MRWLVLCLALAAVAGCGGDDEPAAEEEPRLVVSAAASLSDALTACSKEFEGADVKLSFAGSDELAAQIRQGVKPDVYAAANTRLPEELNQEGLLGTPVEFATNELVIAVGGEGTEVEKVEDLAKPGMQLAIGAESVPVGAYTREVLGRLPAGLEEKILANVRSEEPDVKGVVGKLTQGAADAGFVYVTDVTEGITGVELPPELRPTVAYGAGVVEGAKQPELVQQFLDGLTEGPCADALREEGFGPPPSG
ncbi:MAG: molybdate ABC transporter substrate-binding protein [Solirubrobacterales bacterium]